MNYKKTYLLGILILNSNLIFCMLENNKNEIKEEKKIFNLGNLSILPDDIKKLILNHYIYYIYDKYKVTGLLAVSKDFNQFIKKYYKKIFRDIYKELNSSLICSSCEGNIKEAELLIKAGANVNYSDAYSNTPLILTSDRNFTIAKLLIENGANIDLINNFGQTALMKACLSRQKNIVELLINSGADVYIKWHNNLAIDCTRDKEIKKIIQIKMDENKKRKLEEIESKEDNNNYDGFNCNIM